MAATTKAARSRPVNDADPYFYGWREVERVTPGGRVVWDCVPLTEEDALHPQEGDHVTQTNVHADRCRYLADVCALQLAGDPTAVVLNDVRIAWDVRNLRPHGPDVAVVVGVRAPAGRVWRTFSVREEGVRPALVLEVTSPATVRNDLIKKVRQYARARVPQYVIVDGVMDGQAGPVWRLLDYRLAGEHYEERSPDERGWVPLAAVGLWLGVVDGEPVCFDAAGQPIGGFTAQVARAEAEAARADAEAARAEAETARADAEAAARTEAEARLRALEDEVRRLRGR